MSSLVLWCALWIAAAALPAGAAPAREGLRHTAANENFYGVEIAGDRVWIVGYYGTILHSPDRGTTWTLQKSPVRSALYRVSFAKGEQGWIVGSFGTLLHTGDGGASWTVRPSGTDEHLFDLAWLDERRGMAVGSRGTILRTDDGGQSWIDRSLAEDLTLNSIVFADSRRGWIAAEFGVIFHSGDGGASWLKQQSPVEVAVASGESQNLFSLLFDPQRTGWAFGLDGVILRTRNGAGWEIIRGKQRAAGSFEENHLFAAASFGEGLWAVGERGTLLQANRGSGQWRPIDLDIPRVSLNAIAFNDDGFGLAVGNRGVVLSTQDGGKTWHRLKIEAQSFVSGRNRLP